VTPAEELRAAADRVQAWADAATGRRWRPVRTTERVEPMNDLWDVWDADINGFAIAESCVGADAAWIAGMGPRIAPHLVLLFRREAAECIPSAGTSGTPDPLVLALARAINRNQQEAGP
jgi:hypothetical protein